MMMTIVCGLAVMGSGCHFTSAQLTGFLTDSTSLTVNTIAANVASVLNPGADPFIKGWLDEITKIVNTGINGEIDAAVPDDPKY
jgi:hypothetical protein